jgi:hypothetical protein
MIKEERIGRIGNLVIDLNDVERAWIIEKKIRHRRPFMHFIKFGNLFYYNSEYKIHIKLKSKNKVIKVPGLYSHFDACGYLNKLCRSDN